jgi:hypothetical protein
VRVSLCLCVCELIRMHRCVYAYAYVSVCLFASIHVCEEMCVNVRMHMCAGTAAQASIVPVTLADGTPGFRV